MLGRLQKKLFLSVSVTEGGERKMADGGLSKGELMSMLRRGARVLTRVFESPEHFLKSSVEDILQKSMEYQKRVDDEVDVPEEDDFQLEGMEMVRSRLFEGEHVVRSDGNLKDIGKEWSEVQKRVREKRVVVVDGFEVLKETVGCTEWEAARTFTGSGVAEVKKRSKKKFGHEEVCVLQYKCRLFQVFVTD